MVLYFSATGNSKYIAKRIAETLNTEFISIEEIKDYEINNVDGFVSPTYAWGIPSIVEDFLNNHKLVKHDNYLFYVATYGTTPGQNKYHANKALNKGSNIFFDAYFSVKMPDTWTPIFDMSNKEKVAKKNGKIEPKINEIICKIKDKNVGNFTKDGMPKIAKIVYPHFYNKMRKTKNFSVSNGCIGCGLCERKCPVKAIKIIDGRPTWTKDSCVMCLGCLHRCPKFAIQYGKKTSKHGQYLNPHVKV